MEEDVRSHFQVGALCTIAVFGIGINCFIFLLFYNRKSVRTFSNRFVLSLASCHILQCLLIIPSFVVSIRKWFSGNSSLKITDSLTICINLATVLSILLIAIDRNCAVNSPLHYTMTITKKRASLLIGFIWMISILLAVPTLFGVYQLKEAVGGQTTAWGFERVTSLVYSIILSLVGFVVPFISVTCLYFAMFRAVKTNNSRARRNSSNSSFMSSDVVVNIKPPKNFGENEYSLRRNFPARQANRGCCCFAGRHKAAVTGLIVVVSFVACWSPYFLTLVYHQFQRVTSEVQFWVHLATYFSCLFNPYVYFYRNKNTWKQTKKLISRTIRRRRDFIAHPTARKHRIDTSKCVLRLPTSFSHNALATQTPLKGSFSHNSIPEDKSHKHIFLGEEISAKKNIGVFSVDPIKALIHQDSSSSNDSSEACVTTVMMGSCISIDVDSTVWYQAFHRKLNEDSMTEIPLDDVVTI